MLYDPKWAGKKVKPTLAGIIAWLETKNPNEVYNYTMQYGCAAAQYLQHIGAENKGCFQPQLAEMFGADAAKKFLPDHAKTHTKSFGRLLSDLKSLPK